MSCLIDILTQSRVRTPASRSPSESACLDYREDQRLQTESSSRSISNDETLVSLARQVEPSNLQGVYDIAGSVFA